MIAFTIIVSIQVQQARDGFLKKSLPVHQPVGEKHPILNNQGLKSLTRSSVKEMRTLY